MIEVSGLSKSFGNVRAVTDVSFVARDGEVTGLLGPNGAGKTTTLRVLYGLLAADSGTASIDGVEVGGRTQDAQRLLGVLPDAHGLYARLTAREHMRYFGQLQGVAKRELERRIDELAALLGMDGIIDRRVHGFSQGERVKVAMGRALVHEPNNIVLDEPTNGLDVGTTRAMRKLIRSMRADGKCVLFSSHIMHEVTALCDRIVIIAAGRTVAQGTPAEIIAETGHSSLEDAFVHLAGIEEEASV
ncbi:MAG: ATP-binding cassette domain-containing protein [Gemmatimonadetes bacterium]|nr:ATP-binding cassette domain-containing protein [Gemmatimonadota bacterium]